MMTARSNHSSDPTLGSAARRGTRPSWRHGLAILLLSAAGSAHAAEFTHKATLTFCAMTSKVHAVCTDRVRDGHDIVGLNLDCKLTRDIAGGDSYAMAETRQRVSAEDDSLEVTKFDAPHRFNARYCTVNRGRYLQGSILGPTVIIFPLQSSDQSCANKAPPNPVVDQ